MKGLNVLVAFLGGAAIGAAAGLASSIIGGIGA